VKIEDRQKLIEDAFGELIDSSGKIQDTKEQKKEIIN
jgi:predicted house-cleaning noncanonical NTP pyrophosphatase (MazG superfamily)